MSGSQITGDTLIFTIYKDTRTVFRLIDIALLTGDTNFPSLNNKLNYYVRSGKLNNPRKGVYTKVNYNPEELACNIFTPSYISLEYVLQKAGIVFQYDSGITSVSYLSRSIEVGDQAYSYRKMKGEILVSTAGIVMGNTVSIATPERAFLDMLYLSPKYYFDNLNPLNNKTVYKLLPVYQSKALTLRVTKLLQK